VTCLVPLVVALGAWPAPDAKLAQLPLPPRSGSKVRVFVDAGHGAPGNVGNHGCHCQLEADFTLRAARHLAKALLATGRFEVELSRDGDAPAYDARLARAAAWKADAVVSLHSDSRGEAHLEPVGPDGGCLRNDDAPGFSVLWSDEGSPKRVEERERLGRALSRRLHQAGFPEYSGVDYGGLYRQDSVEPGCWIDIRPPGKRVYFMRKATVPAVIIETHHALDSAEVARWDEAGTLDAFAAAVAAGVLDASAAVAKSAAQTPRP
jgi:N-acetylmuramoyl-L-alanine amidase